jgi:hypothetical protein
MGQREYNFKLLWVGGRITLSYIIFWCLELQKVVVKHGTKIMLQLN